MAANELRVEADMRYSRTGAGLHRFTDTADGETYLALHGGLDNAQRVFAAFDQPDLKAVTAAAVTAPESWTVVGNGLARPAGRGRWELTATPPISTYVVTLVAGPYYSVRAEHRGIPLGLHARQSLAGHLDRDAAEILAVTRACFDRYREIFTEPYPYDSYDQAFVPELESGAMENPGCVTALAEVAAGGGAQRARVWCLHGFPRHAVDATTLRAGERCLDGLAGSLRRLLADQLEDLRRSLAVRSAG